MHADFSGKFILHERRTENRKKVTIKRYNALLVNMV